MIFSPLIITVPPPAGGERGAACPYWSWRLAPNGPFSSPRLGAARRGGGWKERGAGGQPREERGRFGEGAGKARERAETAEEKRARKAAVKAAQREARAAKKELKTLFKQGAQKQAAQGPRGPSVVPM